jgi:uncharacterized protein (DUF1501 family)
MTRTDRHDTARTAFNQLSVRDNSEAGFNRRRFLQMVGSGVGSAAFGATAGPLIAGVFPNEIRDAWAGTPIAPNEGVLVLIGMYGGNDGLNTVVPYTNPLYYNYRGPQMSIPAESVLPINDSLGLHPNLPYLKSLYDNGRVAVIQGLGYANPNLSHFSSMATWMHGRAGGGTPTTGWVGRWLDGLGGAPDLFKAATVGSAVPLHLVGATRRGTAVPDGGTPFGIGNDPNDVRVFNAVRRFSAAPGGRGPWHDAIANAQAGQLTVAQTVGPLYSAALPDGALRTKMAIAARLINADLGLRVIDTGWGDFDTHSAQPFVNYSRMIELDTALEYFFENLDPRFNDRVSVMTFSEFGRTPWANDSFGTDHGTSNTHFIIGSSVKGGVYGQPSSLVGLGPLDRMAATVDFRSMYATALDQWLGGGASTVLNGNFGTFDVFRPPGTGHPSSPPKGVLFSEFVGLTPQRIMDTRSGLGTALGPIGPARLRTLQVTGRGGVPATGVLAAVLNVTAFDGFTGSFFTVWPTGTPRQETSTVNIEDGNAVPNLAISMIGDGGRVNIFNSVGTAHCIVDIVGYFRASNGGQFAPLSPKRILDTREGLGAAKAPLGSFATIELQVAGAGGVAPDAEAVVMNVTVTNPTETSYITAWPTGQPKPVASNLNYVATQTCPNLVICKLGSGGKVSLQNALGTTDVIADVLGYFKAGAGGRLTPLAPARILDTRIDGGRSNPVGRAPLRLQIAGRGGVPSTGASAVVLNITATGGDTPTYVTVFPSTEDQPTASNLNVWSDQTRANLVICKIGTDGAVKLYNDKGALHLIADVVGYFTG